MSSYSEDYVYSIIDRVGEILGVDVCDVILEIDPTLSAYGELEYLHDLEALLVIRDDLDIDALKKTIIHELTHYKQHVDKRLVQGHMKVCWEGRWYSIVDFLNSPWEVEAYENEVKYLDLL